MVVLTLYILTFECLISILEEFVQFFQGLNLSLQEVIKVIFTLRQQFIFQQKDDEWQI